MPAGQQQRDQVKQTGGSLSDHQACDGKFAGNGQTASAKDGCKRKYAADSNDLLKEL